MMKRLPVGISDFQEVIEGDYYYVDKSLFIKELMDAGGKAILIPRPRRFGKTLNLSMLRYFFEKVDSSREGLFHDLAIWQQGETYTRHQGKYPVMFLTFKDVKCSKWADCEVELRRVIADEYRKHQYVLDILDEDMQKEYRDIMRLAATDSAYRNSLKNLTVWLERYYGQRVVILIDEYDTPIQQGYLYDYYDDVIGFMRIFLSGALKDNSSLERGVLTGILRVAKESIFSGLNNLEVCSLLATGYSTHFGLLESEVETMLSYFEVGLDAEQVKAWYNGYVIGETTIYNPWSIINFTKSWETGFRPYWINTSSNDLIRQLLTQAGASTKRDMESLLQGECVRKEINDNISFREIERHPDVLWSFLLFSGYLKIVSKEMDLRLYGDLMIPNREVAYLFEDIVLGWFRENMDADDTHLMLNALASGDVGTFAEIFQHYVQETFSVFDTGGREPEKVYHAFVLGLLVHLRDRYEVKSNRESGFGRYDVMLIPRNRDQKGISTDKGVIFEFKKIRRGETVEEAAASALQQIDEKRYEDELVQRGIQDIVKLGIAFDGKEVCIRS
jgi:hypothetical protein